MAAEIVRLIGVYNGDGGIRGQVAHAFGKLRGTASCALCDITYRGVRKNPEWSDVACATGVPFDLVHLNERSPEVAAFTGNESVCRRRDDRRTDNVVAPSRLRGVVRRRRRLPARLEDRCRHRGPAMAWCRGSRP